MHPVIYFSFTRKREQRFIFSSFLVWQGKILPRIALFCWGELASSSGRNGSSWVHIKKQRRQTRATPLSSFAAVVLFLVFFFWLLWYLDHVTTSPSRANGCQWKTSGRVLPFGKTHKKENCMHKLHWEREKKKVRAHRYKRHLVEYVKHRTLSPTR